MCELLGASMNKPTDLKKYLTAFFSHSGNHPHGWGLMTLSSSGEAEIQKEPERASFSRAAAEAAEKLLPQTTMLAHIRYATVGAKKATNAHPFEGWDSSGRRWILIHNGTIYSGLELMRYLEVQKGDTDSERILLYFLDNINKALAAKQSLSAEDRFRVFEETVNRLSYRNKLNLMLYDGELLYVHMNMAGTLAYKRYEDGIVISTQPLDHGQWQDYPLCRAYAYRGGEEIFAGEYHGNEFIPTLEYISAMDAMNI